MFSLDIKLFDFIPREMTPEEFYQFQIAVGLADEFETASLMLWVEPDSWFDYGSGSVVNNTDEMVQQEVEVGVSSGYISFSFGFIGTPAVDITSSVMLISLDRSIASTVFDEPFFGTLDYEYGTDHTSAPEGFLKTYNPYHYWAVQYLPNRPPASYMKTVGIEFTSYLGFFATLDHSSGYIGRGFLMIPSAFPTTEITNLILSISSSVTEAFLSNDKLYYGIWICGNSADLWIDLTDENYSTDYPEYSPYPSLLPVAGPISEDPAYNYVLLGAGEHNIDLGAYDSYLGEEIVSVMIEAYIMPVAG